MGMRWIAAGPRHGRELPFFAAAGCMQHERRRSMDKCWLPNTPNIDRGAASKLRSGNSVRNTKVQEPGVEIDLLFCLRPRVCQVQSLHLRTLCG